MGARRLRRGARAGDGLDRDRLEARQLRRADEGVPARAAALVEPVDERPGAGLDRDRRGHLGRHDDLRQLRRAGAAELQADAGLLVDRPRRLHPGRRGGGQRLDRRAPKAAGAVLYYLVVYAFANVGAFAVAAWLVRDKDSDDIDDLNGLGYQEPLLAICILLLMLSLIGIPPLAGFFGKLYMFMEALEPDRRPIQPVTLIWLVALGLFNSVVSAFYYVRVLKAMFLREPGAKRLAPASRAIAVPIVLGTIVVVLFGIMPDSLMSVMQAAAVPMLTKPVIVPPFATEGLKPRPPHVIPPGAPVMAGPGASSTAT